MNTNIISILNDKKKLNDCVNKARLIAGLMGQQERITEFDSGHCCICGKEITEETACNPEPVMSILHSCCAECDQQYVVPIRVAVGGNPPYFYLFPDEERELQNQLL